MHSLQTESNIFNVIQTDYWKKRKGFFDNAKSILIPLFFYFDEYEVGNPLGSHKSIHKLGAVYVKIACLPPAIASGLGSIFLLSLFHASDKKEFSNENVFVAAINDLIYLEQTGIEINVDNVVYQIKFQISGILGDNLGLNSVLGFNESFTATYFCRFCTASSVETGKMCKEITTLMRNRDSYEAQINLKNAKATGIKEKCTFNQIPSFHVTENYVVDIMHDLFEGVCGYDMVLILNYFITTKKYFSLNILNNQILYFDGKSDAAKNRPSLISHMEFAKGSLSMSASEMIFFIKNFALMMGQYVPLNDKYWRLYLLLRKIVILVLSDYVNDKLINEVEILVERHHTLYLQLSKTSLKPKYHFMVHYCTIMRVVGPLKQIWCMRYESKHRQSKLSSNVVASRVNITKTLSIKHQLALANTFLTGINLRPINYTDQTSQNLYTKLDKITIFGTTYTTQGVLNFETSDAYILYEIKKIIIINNSEKVFFYVMKYSIHLIVIYKLIQQR